MKIAVYTHSMEIGGSQLNAIEISEAVQSCGHEVILVAETGRLTPLARRAGLEHIEVSENRRRPSLAVMNLLCKLVRDRHIDVVHGYEWPPAMDAWLGPHLRLRTPVVATVMSAAVAPFLAKSIPLVVGTRILQAQCYRDGFQHVDLLEPPVNIYANAPTFDGGAFRQRWGFDTDTVVVGVVCRLARELKLEGLLAACRVIGRLAHGGANVRLVIVGDGPARTEIEAEAGRANALTGRRTVILTGELDDPRPAYAAADIMLGMGGSALRGLSFGKPLIVQGESGFWRLCNEQSLEFFLEAGWYGIGDGSVGDGALRAALEPLLDAPDLRANLGAFGRNLIVERFSLEHAAQVQLKVYEAAIATRASIRLSEVSSTIVGLARHKVRRRWERLWGTVPSDDFNALREQRTSGRTTDTDHHLDSET